MIHLVFLNGPEQGKTIAITNFPTTIGQDDASLLSVNDTTAHWRAAEIIHLNEGEYFLKPVGEKQSDVKINQRIIDRLTAMHSGDVVRIGRTLLLVGVAGREPTAFRKAESC